MRKSQSPASKALNLADSVQDYIFLINKDLLVQYVNDFTAKSLKLSVKKIIGKSLLELFPPELAVVMKTRLKSVFESGKPSIFEDKIKLFNKDVWLDTKLIPIKGKNSKVNAVMGVSRDINERKKIEAALINRERFLGSIFDSIQDGINILDMKMNIVRVNAAMEKLYPHAVPLPGKKCYKAYHGLNKPCVVCPSQETLKNANPSNKIVPKRDKQGKIIGWIDLFSFPFFDAATGKMSGVIEYVRDITEQREIERAKEELNQELLKSNIRLKQSALIDSQTGLYNHRYLNEIIEAEFFRAKRYSYPLSVIMIDLDYFKSINDVYGHLFGDLVIKQLSDQLKKAVRKYDTVIRYGGEEFLILSPVIDREAALSFARRLMESIVLHNFGNHKHSVKLKLSISVAAFPEDVAVRGMDLVELASKILDKAKENGGSKVYSSLDLNNGRHFVPAEESTDVIFLKEKINKLTKRSNQNLIEAIFAFAKTIEVKDRYTGEHVERTVSYAVEIARALKLSEYEIEQIKQASVLHDLGKIGISEKILYKKTKLTKKEFEEIKRHPQIGVDIIRPIHFLHPVIPYVLHHHEKWNGTGYPYGLKQDGIPLGARIVAIADVYQALISDRPYRKAYSKAEAVNIIKEEAGILFDPTIVSIFLEILKSEP